MNTARTFIITTAAFLVAVSGSHVSAFEAPASTKQRAGFAKEADVAPETAVFAPDGDQELMELGQWAIDRFETAAMSVPAIEIRMHRTNSECGGHRGTFNPTAKRIDVCVAEPLVVLHEIAHAWAHENLTERERDAFVTAGGYESWNHPDTAWGDRGSEHAADAIAWGLMEEPQMMVTADGPIAQINADFRMLTGVDSPRIVRR